MYHVNFGSTRAANSAPDPSHTTEQTAKLAA